MQSCSESRILAVRGSQISDISKNVDTRGFSKNSVAEPGRQSRQFLTQLEPKPPKKLRLLALAPASGQFEKQINEKFKVMIFLSKMNKNETILHEPS